MDYISSNIQVYCLAAMSLADSVDRWYETKQIRHQQMNMMIDEQS